MFVSDPYPVLLKTGLAVAADLIHSKGKSKYEKSLIISAYSLAKPLVDRMAANQDSLSGIEVWIYKAGPERQAAYIVED